MRSSIFTIYDYERLTDKNFLKEEKILLANAFENNVTLLRWGYEIWTENGIYLAKIYNL